MYRMNMQSDYIHFIDVEELYRYSRSIIDDLSIVV